MDITEDRTNLPRRSTNLGESRETWHGDRTCQTSARPLNVGPRSRAARVARPRTCRRVSNNAGIRRRSVSGALCLAFTAERCCPSDKPNDTESTRDLPLLTKEHKQKRGHGQEFQPSRGLDATTDEHQTRAGAEAPGEEHDQVVGHAVVGPEGQRKLRTAP